MALAVSWPPRRHRALVLVVIGPHTLRTSVLLAPMAGITDAPYRRLAWRLGAGYVASEMIDDRPEHWGRLKSTRRRVSVGGECLNVVQIAGSEPQTMAAVARQVYTDGAQIIDINFGCPAKKVCKKAAGSALMRDEGLMADIVRAVVAAVPVPITAKMRTGWSRQHRNGLAVALRLQDAGISALTVHGRTRACRFNGQAEIDTVASIKARLSVPVIANGDIDSIGAAQRVLRQAGVDGVMIGRGALGRPWLLGQVAASLGEGPSVSAPTQLGAFIADHVAAMHEFYGEATAVRMARKHVGWYLAQAPLVAERRRALRARFNALTDAQAQLDLLRTLDERTHYDEAIHYGSASA
ncbi:MAG: tRNA dihydrouridine synthase DusB [Pseudomonadales bacterium]